MNRDVSRSGSSERELLLAAPLAVACASCLFVLVLPVLLPIRFLLAGGCR